MKQIILFGLIALLLVGCSSVPTVDQIQGTVAAQVSGTLTAQPIDSPPAKPLPTSVPVVTPEPLPTNTSQPTRIPRTNTPKPPPTATSEPETGTRLNPHPYGTVSDLVKGGDLEFQVALSDIKRGDKAWSFVFAANQFNNKPPDDMEYIAVTVVITYTGSDKGPLQMDRRDWVVVTNGQVFEFSAIPTVCCFKNELEDVKVFSGGKAKGVMVWPVYVDDPNPLLVLGMKDDGTGGVYFSTAPQGD